MNFSLLTESRNSQAPHSKTVTVVDRDVPQSAPDAVTDEIGATSAPLLSAAFFIAARCKPFDEDFMLCRLENGHKGPENCLKEGRRATRCAQSVIGDLKAHCAEEFMTHWKCLERKNYLLQDCRPAERALNQCAFKKLNLKKTVPGAGNQPVWEKKKPIYRPNWEYPEGVAMDIKWKKQQDSAAETQ